MGEEIKEEKKKKEDIELKCSCRAIWALAFGRGRDLVVRSARCGSVRQQHGGTQVGRGERGTVG